MTTPSNVIHFNVLSLVVFSAGLVFTEITCVSADARISPGCAGMYSPEHETAWRRIVDYVHRETPAKIALQLGHAGPKGSTQRGWEHADEPLPAPERNWPLIAPSALAYGPRNAVPRAMTREAGQQTYGWSSSNYGYIVVKRVGSDSDSGSDSAAAIDWDGSTNAAIGTSANVGGAWWNALVQDPLLPPNDLLQIHGVAQ